MHKLSALLLPFALLSCAPAPVMAQDKPGNEKLQCQVATKAAPGLAKFAAAVGLSWVKVDKDDTRKFMAAYNKEDPPTAFHADTMQTISSKSEHSSVTIIVLFVDKKACLLPLMPTKVFTEMYTDAVGAAL